MHDRARLADRPRWWQWPTVLSLDAPAIAIVWQILAGRAAGVAIGWPHAFVLGASVWLGYTGDRWLEAWRFGPQHAVTPRHRFHQRWRWPVATVGLFVLVADVAIAWTRLATHQLLAGLVLTAAVLTYLLSHQWLHRHARWRVPKEVCIAALLGAGVVTFLLPASDTAALWWTISVFTLLCFVNCALISRWERNVDVAHGQTSLALDSVGGAQAIRWLPWIVAAGSALLAVFGPDGARLAAWCGVTSGLLLGMIDRMEPVTGWPAARVLSDLALVSPIVPLILL